MNNTAAFIVPKSDKTYIHIEYHPNENQVSSEFQCDQLEEVQQLLCESQKACLAMGYFSIFRIIVITLSAIVQHTKKRLSMIFG